MKTYGEFFQEHKHLLPKVLDTIYKHISYSMGKATEHETIEKARSASRMVSSEAINLTEVNESKIRYSEALSEIEHKYTLYIMDFYEIPQTENNIIIIKELQEICSTTDNLIKLINMFKHKKFD